MSTARIIELPLEIGPYEGADRLSVRPVLLVDDNNLVLFDTGPPGCYDLLAEAIAGAGYRVEDLTGILISHQDQDHFGALAQIRRVVPQAITYASAAQAPGISGSGRPMRLEWAEREWQGLPAATRAVTPHPASAWPPIENAPVDVIVADHDRFGWLGGTEIVFTEGHLPGHFSVYVAELEALAAADAVVLQNGRPWYPENWTHDLPWARRNLGELGSRYRISTLYCYHGGVWSGDVSATLRDLA